MKYLTFILVILIFCSGCTSKKNEATIYDGDTFDYKKSTPLNFLEVLKQNPEQPYVVFGEHHNWIKRKHIPALIKLIDSQCQASPVVSVYSSVAITGTFTVGEEAIFLIEGYRKNVYPPYIHSNFHKVSKHEILEWWEKEQRR